jgi:hypothetical protein
MRHYDVSFVGIFSPLTVMADMIPDQNDARYPWWRVTKIEMVDGAWVSRGVGLINLDNVTFIKET